MQLRMKQISKIWRSSIFLVLLMVFVNVEGRSQQSGQEVDAVDQCILNCDSCFKGEALVRCANECISQDGTVGPTWSHACRRFTPMIQGYSRLRN